MIRALLASVLFLPAAALANGVPEEGVENPSEYFMRICLKDMTVAAGKREELCECVHDVFAYGDTRFGLSDAIALDPRSWEAPDKRMPQDEIGEEVRRVRKECLNEQAQQPAR